VKYGLTFDNAKILYFDSLVLLQELKNSLSALLCGLEECFNLARGQGTWTSKLEGGILPTLELYRESLE
jgi:hypothetical protein